MTCEIVSIIQQCSTNSTLVTFQLPLPPVICCDIDEEIDYQKDLYFNSIIEPTVDYNIQMNTSGWFYMYMFKNVYVLSARQLKEQHFKMYSFLMTI